MNNICTAHGLGGGTWGRGWLPSRHHRSHHQGGPASRGSTSRRGVGQTPCVCQQGGLPPEGGLGRPPCVCLQGRSVSRWVGQIPHLVHGILQDIVNKPAVRILLECFLVH